MGSPAVSFLSAAKTDRPITTAHIKRKYRMPLKANDWPMSGQLPKGGLEGNGGRCRTRTYDNLCVKQTLYQLS